MGLVLLACNPAAAIAFASLLMLCGFESCPSGGPHRSDVYQALLVALLPGALLATPFTFVPWAERRTRWVTAGVVLGAVSTALALTILLNT